MPLLREHWQLYLAHLDRVSGAREQSVSFRSTTKLGSAQSSHLGPKCGRSSLLAGQATGSSRAVGRLAANGWRLLVGATGRHRPESMRLLLCRSIGRKLEPLSRCHHPIGLISLLAAANPRAQTKGSLMEPTNVSPGSPTTSSNGASSWRKLPHWPFLGWRQRRRRRRWRARDGLLGKQTASLTIAGSNPLKAAPGTRVSGLRRQQWKEEGRLMIFASATLANYKAE